MLGIKLGREVEARFERFVRRTGQRKSDIGRAAIIEYMDRHDDDSEFERELKRVAEFERENTLAQQETDELDALAWRTINKLD
jgi:predicted DNA-binding protein